MTTLVDIANEMLRGLGFKELPKERETTLTTDTAKATNWIRGGHHAGRENYSSTHENIEAIKGVIQTTTLKGHGIKTPHLPLFYSRNEEGEWEASTPLTGDAKIRGSLKARATLTLAKMNQIDRMRAKLEARGK